MILRLRKLINMKCHIALLCTLALLTSYPWVAAISFGNLDRFQSVFINVDVNDHTYLLTCDFPLANQTLQVSCTSIESDSGHIESIKWVTHPERTTVRLWCISVDHLICGEGLRIALVIAQIATSLMWHPWLPRYTLVCDLPPACSPSFFSCVQIRSKTHSSEVPLNPMMVNCRPPMAAQ